MLQDRPLRIEVLVNSPGPHDQVRVREPFAALQRQGVDCRIHERPFLFSRCIRPHSLVIWQRPLPESWRRQAEHLQWLRERGCLLFTEWDDHPDLFPRPIRQQLDATDLAPLVLCHALHSSSASLVRALASHQPLGLVFDNGPAEVPALQLDKQRKQPLRLFIGNQNRQADHAYLLPALLAWLRDDPQIQIVSVGDEALAAALPRHRLECHPLLPYAAYRRLLRSCQMALLPLSESLPNRCKTVIKWAEAAAESVVVVAGPELYGSVQQDGQGAPTALVVKQLDALVPALRGLAANPEQRCALAANAHRWVEQTWCLERLLPQRLAQYQALWARRAQMDRRLLERLGARVPLLRP
jgi:hypothetical protein